MQVGPRPVWKDAQHPFRTDRQIQLTGIPTLVHYTENGLDDVRLSSKLEHAQSAAEAEAAAKSFITTTGWSNHRSNRNNV